MPCVEAYACLGSSGELVVMQSLDSAVYGGCQAAQDPLACERQLGVVL